jgi:hypothetical protein
MDGRAVGRWLCNATMLLLAASISSSESLGQVIPASATTVAPSVPTTDIRHLEIGDWYEVAVQRGAISKQYRGTLVKATDRWLVLFTHAEGRTERGVPVLSKTPYINRLFRNVGIGRTTEYRWIPREAATVLGRTLASKAVPLPTPKADVPQGDSHMLVEMVDAGKLDEQQGAISLHNDQLTSRFQEEVAVEKRMPVLGRLPMVGGAFTSESFELRERTREIATKDVLCIVDDSAAADYEELLRLRP